MRSEKDWATATGNVYRKLGAVLVVWFLKYASGQMDRLLWQTDRHTDHNALHPVSGATWLFHEPWLLLCYSATRSTSAHTASTCWVYLTTCVRDWRKKTSTNKRRRRNLQACLRYWPLHRYWTHLMSLLKVFSYSLPSVGPGADPGVQAVSPELTISHPPGGRLPWLSARPAVTFPAA